MWDSKEGALLSLLCNSSPRLLSVKRQSRFDGTHSVPVFLIDFGSQARCEALGVSSEILRARQESILSHGCLSLQAKKRLAQQYSGSLALNTCCKRRSRVEERTESEFLGIFYKWISIYLTR